MVSIKTGNVAVAEIPCEEVQTKKALEILTTRKVEACSDAYSPIVPCEYHGLVQASHMAFAEHRPLVLSPDMIWLAIAQGIATHVNNNAEKLRSQFVSFEGKEKIVVLRNSFIKGSADNDWPGVFGEFSDEIKKRVLPGAYDQVTMAFSTTGPVEKAANEIVLMDTVKSYFDLTVKTMCGIPEVILEGKPEDYKAIADRVEELQKWFGLEWWMKALLPIVSGLYLSSLGKDKTMLKDWYKEGGGSGGPYINGHISRFFPYKKDYQTGGTTSKVEEFEDHMMGGLTSDDLPSGMSAVPFMWEYYEQKFPMNFMAGYIGYTQDKATMAVRPKIGWAITDQNPEMSEESSKVCSKCGKRKLNNQFFTWREEGIPEGLCIECHEEESNRNFQMRLAKRTYR